MGGARRYPYPRWVWAPTGGWWCYNPYWRRNSAMMILASSALAWAIVPSLEAGLTCYDQDHHVMYTTQNKLDYDAKMIRLNDDFRARMNAAKIKYEHDHPEMFNKKTVF